MILALNGVFTNLPFLIIDIDIMSTMPHLTRLVLEIW